MDIYELIGLIIGDGYILYNKKKRRYRLMIMGDIKEDGDYFNDISDFIFKITHKRPSIRIRRMKKGFGLELVTYNKRFVEYLMNDLHLPCGEKTFTITIPKNFLKWSYSKNILRGILESDGSLYFSKSKVMKYPSYPRLEIRTSSKNLAFQVFHLLKSKEFNVQIMKTKYDDYKVYLSGECMLYKWKEEIGFSNFNTISKYLLWEKLGYYIPRISFKDRKELLKMQ